MSGFVQKEHIDLFSPIFVRHAISALEEFYERTFSHKQFTHWGEKLPSTGAALALQAGYPNARFIVLIRDPRDAWCSVLHFRDHKHVRPELANQTAGEFGKSWNSIYNGYLKYLNHHLEVHYEDLVRNPTETLGRVLSFLDLSGAEDLVRALDHEGSFSRHGSSRSPTASIGRWREELDPKAVREIEDNAAEMMLQFDYELSSGP